MFCNEAERYVSVMGYQRKDYIMGDVEDIRKSLKSKTDIKVISLEEVIQELLQKNRFTEERENNEIFV